jgi:uncharacterized protein (DUF4415 family)
MQKEGTIVRYTAEELEAKRRRGEDQTNVEAVKALTEEELEASIDHEEEGEVDWSTVSAELPKPKAAFTMYYDVDVLEWFRAQGPGYQTKMNAVLKGYIEAQSKSEPSRR